MVESVKKQNANWAQGELATLEKTLIAEHGVPFVMSAETETPEGIIQTETPAGIMAKWIKINQPRGGFHVKFMPGTGDFMRVGLIEQQVKDLAEVVAEG